MAEFDWHHSIARPRKPPIGCKHLADISYTSWVIADLVPNFVAMATGVGHCNIWLTPVNSQTPKIPYQTQTSNRYLLYKPSYSQFCHKIWLPWQQGLVVAEFGWHHSIVRPRKPRYTQRSRGYHLCKPSYSRFCPKFRCHGNGGHLGVNLYDAIK